MPFAALLARRLETLEGGFLEAVVLGVERWAGLRTVPRPLASSVPRREVMELEDEVLLARGFESLELEAP